MVVSDVHINKLGRMAESQTVFWGVGCHLIIWDLLTLIIKCFEIFIVLVFYKCPMDIFINLINRKRETPCKTQMHLMSQQ